MIVLLVMIQEFYCTNTCEYTNIHSCSRKLVFDSSPLQEGTFVYTLVKLYIKVILYTVFLYSTGMHVYNKMIKDHGERAAGGTKALWREDDQKFAYVMLVSS